MNRNTLHLLASNALDRARNIQQQVQTRGMQSRFESIGNSRYGTSTKDSSIILLEHQRDDNLSDAIYYALDLIEKEREQNVSGVFSLGGMVINSINSFVKIYGIKPRIPSTTTGKLSYMSSKLLFAGIGYINVKSDIDDLERTLRYSY